jgi:hypothetical protein
VDPYGHGTRPAGQSGPSSVPRAKRHAGAVPSAQKLDVHPQTTVRRTFVFTLAASLLAGCASHVFDAGRTEAVLPVHRAWIDGRMVEYVTTDISDLAMARTLGVNFVPRLAQAVKATPGSSVLERVYKFHNDGQVSVFQSAPEPVGAENLDQGYSPLWRLVLVKWSDTSKARELRSEEEILQAADRNELALEVTDIVVNCPVVRGRGGQALKGVR